MEIPVGWPSRETIDAADVKQLRDWYYKLPQATSAQHRVIIEWIRFRFQALTNRDIWSEPYSERGE